jgi:hypothetical protein
MQLGLGKFDGGLRQNRDPTLRGLLNSLVKTIGGDRRGQ